MAERVATYVCAACTRMVLTDDYFTVSHKERTFTICYPCWMATPLSVVESAS